MNKFIKTPFAIADAYKLAHWIQYPDGTTGVYSNFTPRKSRRPGVNKFVYFGLQYFLVELNDQFNNNFFNLSEDEAVKRFDAFYTRFFGVPNPDSNDKVRALHQLGYLPIEVRALPEGSAVNHNIPTATFKSTHEDFFWFEQFLETWHSCMVWKMSTSATTAYYYRKCFEKYNKLTSDIEWIVDFQGHDFSFRGMSNVEDACASGAGHLISFKGTDTCPSLDFIDYYYPPTNDDLLGTSVPATEHSVAESFLAETTLAEYKKGKANTHQSDYDYIDNVLNKYPSGIVSIVCDTYDFWHLVTQILPLFKDRIMAREGKVVIRPDSSPKTPVEIIVGDPEAPKNTPEYKGLVQCLYEIFGGTTNSKGYIDLDSHIGAIYGDSITLEYQEKILDGLMKNGYSSNNIVLGIGSFTYSYVTRDTHGIAIKCTAVASGRGSEQHWRATYKDPATDNSGKKSARGFLKLELENGEYVLYQDVTEEEANTGALELVYRNSEIVRTQSFNQVREQLAKF